MEIVNGKYIYDLGYKYIYYAYIDEKEILHIISDKEIAIKYSKNNKVVET